MAMIALMRKKLRYVSTLAAVMSGMACPGLVAAQERDPMQFYDADGLKVRGHLQFGLNAITESNLFWDLAGTTAPGSGFDPEASWLEAYIKPGISFEYQLDTGAFFLWETFGCIVVHVGNGCLRHG
jgi:hypothetical protein